MTESSKSGGRPRSFFGELRRRHVFRVVAVYVAVAFVVLQAADLTSGPLHLPAWTLTFVVVLALLGLPVAGGEEKAEEIQRRTSSCIARETSSIALQEEVLSEGCW